MIQVNKESIIGLLRFIPSEAFNISLDDDVVVITEQFLKPKINNFFNLVKENQCDFEYLAYDRVFSDIEFANKRFRYQDKSFVQLYVYGYLMAEIKKSVLIS